MADSSKVRRGDLVVVEMRPTYTTSNYGRVVSTEYRLFEVTNLTRAGEIKMVRDAAYEESYARRFPGMLHRTGAYWLLPRAAWDVSKAQRLAREHTYPNSTTPRAWASLSDARDALRSARLTNGGE